MGEWGHTQEGFDGHYLGWSVWSKGIGKRYNSISIKIFLKSKKIESIQNMT